jgi:hypothetical protein
VSLDPESPRGTSFQTGRQKNQQSRLPPALLGVAVLAGFAIFIIYLLNHIQENDIQWSRAIYLFGGVEAVAFAAAGYFFGTQVQRGRVEEAKKEADAATQVKEAAQTTASAERRAARVLAEGVVASADTGLMSSDAPGSATLLRQARALLQE